MNSKTFPTVLFTKIAEFYTGPKINLLLISKAVRTHLLKTCWKPWDRNYLGFAHACKKGYIGYFKRWMKIAKKAGFWPAPPTLELSIYDNAWTLYRFQLVRLSTECLVSDSVDIYKILMDPFFEIEDPEYSSSVIINELWEIIGKYHDNTKILKYLLKKADSKESVKIGLLKREEIFLTMYAHCCSHGWVKAMKILLKHDEITPPPNFEHLELAVDHNRASIVELILKDGRVDPNGDGCAGYDLFEKAFAESYAEILDMLLEDWRFDPPGWYKRRK